MYVRNDNGAGLGAWGMPSSSPSVDDPGTPGRLALEAAPSALLVIGSLVLVALALGVRQIGR